MLGWSAAIKNCPLYHPIIYKWVSSGIEKNLWELITDTVLQGTSKAMDVRFYWICDQCQFLNVYQKQGKQNLSKYPPKHHSTQHHIEIRPTYVINTTQKQTKTLFKWPKPPTTPQGCVQAYLPPIVKQPLVYESLMLPATVGPVLNQHCYSCANSYTFPNKIDVKYLPFK